MLSVVIGKDHEWWVNSQLFDRLFESGLRQGTIPESLSHLQDDINIHYGIELHDEDYSDEERTGFIRGLTDAALRDLELIGEPGAESPDAGYKMAMVRWLDVVAAHEADSGSPPEAPFHG